MLANKLEGLRCISDAAIPTAIVSIVVTTIDNSDTSEVGAVTGIATINHPSIEGRLPRVGNTQKAVASPHEDRASAIMVLLSWAVTEHSNKHPKIIKHPTKYVDTNSNEERGEGGILPHPPLRSSPCSRHPGIEYSKSCGYKGSGYSSQCEGYTQTSKTLDQKLVRDRREGGSDVEEHQGASVVFEATILEAE